jgi:putative phosphoesterase
MPPVPPKGVIPIWSHRFDSGPARIAVLADIHGNVTALEAVLADVRRTGADLVVFGGDLTWGPEPEETLAIVDELRLPAVFVRGNAERTLIEYSTRRQRGEQLELTPREAWELERHPQPAIDFLSTFVEQTTVHVDGLGAVRFCHGSPRSDEELITPKTPAARIRALSAEMTERVLVSAHTHLQFDRTVAGIRSINPGSVGMAYADNPGAYWAMLGPDVELRSTDYDLERAAARYRATTDPLREQMVALLFEPPRPAEVIEHAEQAEFSG